MSGSKVRAVAVGVASCGLYSANLTPGHRRCRRSPADATEGNGPKTDRRSTKLVVRYRRLGEFGRRFRCWQRGSPETAHPGSAGAARRPGPPQWWRRSRVPAAATRPNAFPSAWMSRTGHRAGRVFTSMLIVTRSGVSSSGGPRKIPYTTPAAALLTRALGPCGCFSSGRFSVRSPRSRRQGFAYSAGSRESSSRCTRPPPARLTARARTLLPGFGAVPLGADDATVGNEPHHLTNRRRRALTRPPYGAAPVPRGSQEPPPEAPALHHGS